MIKVALICLIFCAACTSSQEPDAPPVMLTELPADLSSDSRGFSAALCKGAVYMRDESRLLRFDLSRKSWSVAANQIKSSFGCRDGILVLNRMDDDDVVRLYELNEQGAWKKLADQEGLVSSDGTSIAFLGPDRARRFWNPAKGEWLEWTLGRPGNWGTFLGIWSQSIDPQSGEIISCIQQGNHQFRIGVGKPIKRQSEPIPGLCMGLKHEPFGLLVTTYNLKLPAPYRSIMILGDPLSQDRIALELDDATYNVVSGKKFALVGSMTGEIFGIDALGKKTTLMKPKTRPPFPPTKPYYLWSQHLPLVSGDDGVVAAYRNGQWTVIEERVGQAWPGE